MNSFTWHVELGKEKYMHCIKRITSSDFPGGSVVKNLPANARDAGLIPGAGKIAHAPGQLSPRALEPGAPQREEPLHSFRSQPDDPALNILRMSPRLLPGPFHSLKTAEE